MTTFAFRAYRKIKDEGARGIVRSIEWRVHPVRDEPELIPRTLERVLSTKQHMTVVQIGAHVGDSRRDPLYRFLKTHCRSSTNGERPRCRAVLVEPVAYLFERLRENYADCDGVTCENVAIAESSGVRSFYRVREGANPSEHGLPDCADQLGSLLPDRMALVPKYFRKGHADAILANCIVDQVHCITFEELTRRNHIEHIDFLQIDTEGYDFHIIRTIDFRAIRPAFINYERVILGRDESRCRNLLLRHGYHLHDHGEDTLAGFSPSQPLRRWLAQRAYNAWLGCTRRMLH
jgi:FkbM family methyltransferase